MCVRKLVQMDSMRVKHMIRIDLTCKRGITEAKIPSTALQCKDIVLFFALFFCNLEDLPS